MLGAMASSASLYDCYPPLSLIQWDQVHYMSFLLPPATMLHTHCTTLDLYFHSSIFCILLIGQTKAFLQRYNKSLIIKYINKNNYDNNNNNNAVPKPCYELYHKVSINPFWCRIQSESRERERERDAERGINCEIQRFLST